MSCYDRQLGISVASRDGLVKQNKLSVTLFELGVNGEKAWSMASLSVLGKVD
jgi:hypothetical protein